MAVGGNFPFGLNDVKITNSAGDTQADLPAAMTLEFTPRFTAGELRGDDKIQAVASRLDGLDWTLEAGGMPLDAAALMFGFTKNATGTTPNQSEWMNFTGGACMPYFKIYGKALGEDCTDDMHVLIYKAKVTGHGAMTLQDGQFFVDNVTGVAVDNGTAIFQILQHETAAALPSS